MEVRRPSGLRVRSESAPLIHRLRAASAKHHSRASTMTRYPRHKYHIALASRLFRKQRRAAIGSTAWKPPTCQLGTTIARIQANCTTFADRKRFQLRFFRRSKLPPAPPHPTAQGARRALRNPSLTMHDPRCRADIYLSPLRPSPARSPSVLQLARTSKARARPHLKRCHQLVRDIEPCVSPAVSRSRSEINSGNPGSASTVPRNVFRFIRSSPRSAAAIAVHSACPGQAVTTERHVWSRRVSPLMSQNLGDLRQ